MARQWMKFFLDAGIPKESSAEYAVTFESNRMEMDMLAELDKDYLRDLNITALGDIISILRQKKKVLSKAGQKGAEVLIKSEKKISPAIKAGPRSRSSSSSSSNEEERESSEKITKRRKVHPSPPASGVSSRLGPAVSPSTEGVSSRLGPAVSPSPEGVTSRLGPSVPPNTEGVSSRLGPVIGCSEGGVFSRLGGQEAEKSASKNVYHRLGPEGPQEQRISSTSTVTTETQAKAGEVKTKGILKKRGLGEGASLSRSKSAPNIISLKPQSNGGKLKKRISFGKDEIRLMEASPGIKSRLGFGRCSSPPKEIDDIDDIGLQTELKKIAVGKGQFEIRKVMKVVNEKLSTLRDSVTPERKTEPKETLNVPSMKITMKNTEYNKPEDSNYKVDKVDLALRAAKLKSNLDLKREHCTVDGEASGTTRSRKRLVKYETLADGSRIKSYIDYNDPILATVPIKKIRLGDETENTDKKIMLSSDLLAENFTVTRPVSSRRLSDSASASRTLAQRAQLVRNKHQSVSPEKSVKLRIGQSVSPEKSVKLRIGQSVSPGQSVRQRIGDGYKSDGDGGATRPPAVRSPAVRSPAVRPPAVRSPAVRDRIGDRDVQSGSSDGSSIFSRLGSRL